MGRSGNFSLDEFIMLVQLVQERLACAARRRQRLMASKLGLDESQVVELRRVFFMLDEDGTGLIAPDKLRSAFEILQRPMPLENLWSLSETGDTATKGKMHFDGFLNLFG